MIGTMIAVFRVRQSFDIIARTREFVEGVCEDGGLLDDTRRALATFSFEQRRQPDLHPFPQAQPLPIADLPCWRSTASTRSWHDPCRMASCQTPIGAGVA